MTVEHIPEGREARTSRAPVHTARLVLGVVLLVVVFAVVFDNREDVRVRYLFGDVRAPLVVVLLLSAVLGAAIGWLLLHRPHHHD